MKKFISVIMILMLSTAFVSCDSLQTRVIPKLKASAAKKITAAIMKTGECKAEAEISADIYAVLKLESDDGMVASAIGSEAPEGSQQEGVVSEICKAAARLALPTLLRKGVPPKWDCALTDLDSKIGELASGACGKVDF